MTLVIMAAGLGSRYGGLKQLEEIDSFGHILMDYSVYDAKKAGFDRCVLIIKSEIEAQMKSKIEKRKAKWGVKVDFVYQELEDLPPGFSIPEGRKKPFGTAHAVACLGGLIDSPFALINADDYYGRSAFSSVLTVLSEPTDEWATVLYRLKNTLSLGGEVSRGICLVNSGYLVEIREVYGITGEGSSVITKREGRSIDPESLVSMNIWGFTPRIIEECNRRFRLFLEKKLQKNPLDMEFYLTDVISELITEGGARVRVSESRERWQGITHRTDKAATREYLDGLIRKGYYPEDF